MPQKMVRVPIVMFQFVNSLYESGDKHVLVMMESGEYTIGLIANRGGNVLIGSDVNSNEIAAISFQPP